MHNEIRAQLRGCVTFLSRREGVVYSLTEAVVSALVVFEVAHGQRV